MDEDGVVDVSGLVGVEVVVSVFEVTIGGVVEVVGGGVVEVGVGVVEVICWGVEDVVSIVVGEILVVGVEEFPISCLRSISSLACNSTGSADTKIVKSPNISNGIPTRFHISNDDDRNTDTETGPLQVLLGECLCTDRYL
jgi:hypothetical protein